MMNKPFWQDFSVKILEACGVEFPSRIPVSEIKIEVFGKNKLPEIHVTFTPYEDAELKRIIEIFQAAEWKKQ